MTDGERLWREFSSVMEIIRTGAFLPTAVYDEGGKPVEYAFLPLTQYGEGFVTKTYSGAGELLDTYFAERDRETNLHQKASDLLRPAHQRGGAGQKEAGASARGACRL